jgi:MFS transporter, FSR family, fosmidomycin resistance protein
VAVVDEFASGVLPATSIDVARDLAVPAGLAAGGIITAFHVLAIFVEMPLLAWSERVSARRFSAASLAVLALVTCAAALATGPIGLAVCLALYGPASGCALSASEGVLVESRPELRERTLTRLNLAGALGDLAVPLLLGGLAWVGFGWRVALASAATVAALLATVHACATALDRPVPTESDDDDEPPSVLAALRFAFGNRRLLAWSVAVALTSLLDELLVAFAMIRLEHASPLARALAVGAWTAGVLLALVVLERWADHVDSRKVLLASAAVAAISLVVLACSSDVLIASAALFVLGVGTSALHPLASARAYAALPGRPALVNAVAAAFIPFDAFAPLVLGALALWLGTPAAILAILIAPAGIAVAAWRAADV